MAWMQVHAGQDHLSQFTNRKPVDALVEMIWNGLDAEADLVTVDFETASIVPGDRELLHIAGITVEDNGHGISAEVADRAFPSLGDSWKKSLNGRTLNGKRALHGSRGRGRFFAYSLGHRVQWSSVCQEPDGSFHRTVISGDQAKIDGYTIGEPAPARGPTGTVVTITVEQGRMLTALLREDLPVRLAARLAAHLLANRDLIIRVDGLRVDPAPLIEGEPIDIVMDDVPTEELGDCEVPVLTIVDWSSEMKEAPGIVLCNEAGVSLIEVENSAPPSTVKSTAYLKWSGFAKSGADLLLAQMRHSVIIDIAREHLERHVRERVGVLSATIVARLKEEGSYPYPEETPDPITDAERQMFDLIAVTARSALTATSRQQRAMTAQLLHVALQERPESLETILAHAFRLTESEQEQLADMLRFSSLGAIVGAAAEVTRRLDLISTLRYVIYSPDASAEMREVDQLHPLVKDHVWLFGESWTLSRSEVSLTNVLRAAVGGDVALEADLLRQGDQVLLPEGKRGRVDLLLQRSLLGPRDDKQRLVVELKRPSVHLGDKELAQVKRYARALTAHPGAGPSKWTFWLVGSDYKSEIEGDLTQADRPWGHVIKLPEYDIWVTTWGRLLDEADRRLNFYREQLKYEVSQDDAVRRVRARHEQLLPPAALG
jgi:hypothetical protein